jgi:hypothetical protein
MSRKLEIEELSADLAALDALLARSSPNDVVGRIGLESRRREIERRLLDLREQGEEKQAAVALYFGGLPVIGSRGIKAEFASEALSSYQDLVSKIWANSETGVLRAMGPIKDKDASQLHITGIAHGSFGFLLEELDEMGSPLFTTPLKQATSQATELIVSFASEREEPFEQALESVSQRVFSSLRDFLKSIHREEAVFRMVEGDSDVTFDHAAVERAYQRAEAYSIDEEIIETEGELLGVIPIGRRFEFKVPSGDVVSGKVGVLFSQSYLERIEREQLVGKSWKARINRKQKRAFGKTTESYTLLELLEITKPSS